MQSWSSQTGQCIFCTFRLIIKSTPRRNGARSFHNGAWLAHDRQNERSRRYGDGIEGSRRRQLQDKDARPGRFSIAPKYEHAAIRLQLEPRASRRFEPRAFSRSSQFEPLTTKRLQFDPREAIRNSVTVLKGVLKKSRSNDPEYADYASLDPENEYWESFEEKIRPLFSRKRDTDEVPMEAGIASLKEKLVEALQMRGEAGLQKALHFAFIDHVVASRATSNDGKLRQYADLRYPTEWYSTARQLQREIHLHVGPTNSGKTYTALKRLEESGNGFYAGPLRLLAHEVYSRFQAKGVACDLITGDDVRLDESGTAKLSSSTVEMVDVSKAVDVAVIDEIQMMAQEERGWAWTRAFLGANAKEVHLCGEARVVPLVRELAASMGDTLHVHQYERLNPLKAMSRSLRGNLKDLRKGDCIVSFSILGIHAMKKQIEIDTGRRVAIVYGSLPPETRAQQAALFNDPDNDYDFLVASDAIGMGLNLSIKRIIFETIWKRGNHGREKLSVSQLKQIAGRAGRYRTAHNDTKTSETADASEEQIARLTEYRATATVGLVTCLDEEDLGYIQYALRTEAEPIKHAAILPPADFVEEFASHLPSGVPFEYVLKRLSDVSVLHPRYKLCDIKDQLLIAHTLEPVKGLSIVSRYILAASPADTKTPTMQRVLQAYGRCVAEMKMVTIADILEVPLEVLERPLSNDRNYLNELELLHKALILWLWLSYRFVNVFKDRAMAMHVKSMCEEKINRCLLEFSANPKLRARLETMQGPAKSETAKDEAEDTDASGKTSSIENFGAEEELLDQSFATGDNIDPPPLSPDEPVTQPDLSSRESVRKPPLPDTWDNAGLYAEGGTRQNDGPRYASAHG